ncbi:MAG: hypothetical protein AAGE80_01625 [Pseudomonadota bacterium]
MASKEKKAPEGDAVELDDQSLDAASGAGLSLGDIKPSVLGSGVDGKRFSGIRKKGIRVGGIRKQGLRELGVKHQQGGRPKGS